MPFDRNRSEIEFVAKKELEYNLFMKLFQIDINGITLTWIVK